MTLSSRGSQAVISLLVGWALLCSYCPSVTDATTNSDAINGSASIMLMTLHVAFRPTLEAPQADAQMIMDNRFPVPRSVYCV